MDDGEPYSGDPYHGETLTTVELPRCRSRPGRAGTGSIHRPGQRHSAGHRTGSTEHSSSGPARTHTHHYCLNHTYHYCLCQTHTQRYCLCHTHPVITCTTHTCLPINSTTFLNPAELTVFLPYLSDMFPHSEELIIIPMNTTWAKRHRTTDVSPRGDVTEGYPSPSFPLSLCGRRGGGACRGLTEVSSATSRLGSFHSQ